MAGPLSGTSVPDKRTSAKGSQTFSSMLHRPGITVDPNDSKPWVCAKQGRTVAAKPAGPVHDRRAGSEVPKGLDHGLLKDG